MTEPVARGAEPALLQYQYGTTERLQIRIESHQRYSERRDNFYSWVLDQLEPLGGELVLDVGCGTGGYHPHLAVVGVRAVVALDASPGMVAASRQQARTHQLPVHVLQADAQHLPLPGGTVDRAMANHVLFHVPDQRLALRELRRVLAPTGRVVLVTNAADHSARLRGLHEQAARQLGYEPAGWPGDRFHLDHLPLVQEVFATAERRERPDAFLFPTAEAALRFYASGPIDSVQNAPADGSHRGRLLALVGEQVEAIIAQEGVFRVAKNAGCFVADPG